MLRETRWLAGALAAALWVAPAAAQTSSSGQQETTGTGSTSPGATGQEQKPGAVVGEKESSGEKAHAMGHMAPEAAHTLAKMHAGNQQEIEAGAWMQEHATSDKVKEFAKKMVDDHGKMDEALTSFAQKQNVDLTAAEHVGHAAKPSKGAKTTSLEDLKSMQGAQADRAYMKMMVEDHTKDVKEAKTAAQHAKQAKDTELAKLLDTSAKKMEDHLEDAQKIQRELSRRQARTPRAQ